MYYLSQMSLGAKPSPLELSFPSLSVDVRRRGIDPFLSGVVIGAVAAVIGMLLGFFLFVPT
jgi:hypothetical protein